MPLFFQCIDILVFLILKSKLLRVLFFSSLSHADSFYVLRRKHALQYCSRQTVLFYISETLSIFIKLTLNSGGGIGNQESVNKCLFLMQ